MSCIETYGIPGCYRLEDGSKKTVIVHNVVDSSGSVVATLYLDEAHLPVAGATAESVTLGACPTDVECVESQEYTYGLDNTGTDYRWPDATYQLTLSDGSTLTWKQSAAAAPGWAAQLTEWAANIQAEADAAGLRWFVEPRFIDNPNPVNIDGTINGPGGTPSGLPGAPSIPVAQALYAGGMEWRYINFQICPGQPVPAQAELIEVSDQGAGIPAPELPFSLTTAGPVLGPIQKFWMCAECGREPVWYLADGVTLADEGQIPDCWEPCGTLTTSDGPPVPSCQFEIDVACDNNNSQNTADFTNTITRRAKVCNGEQIAVDYFQQDPNDPSALIPYELQGAFVDCASGQPTELPVPPCEDFEIVELFSMVPAPTGTLRNREWDIGPVDSRNRTVEEGRAIRETFDFSQATTVDGDWTFLSVNDTNNDPNVTDVQVIEGYIIVDQPMQLRWRAGSLGYFALELGECCGPMEVVLEGASGSGNADPTVPASIPRGIHQIRMWNVDDFQNTNRTVDYSFDGGATWTADNTPPGIRLNRAKPNEVCKKVKVCKPSGLLMGLLDGANVDPADCYECALSCAPTCCGSSGSAGPTSQTARITEQP